MAGVPNVSSFRTTGLGVKTLGASLSKAGSIISLVCAVHCALTPLVLLALPLLAAQYGGVTEGLFGQVFSHSAEWVFLGVIVVIAGFGVLVTYPVHQDSRPAILTVSGFLVLLSVRLFVEHGSIVEVTGDLIGASLIAWGGFVNRSSCRCHARHEDDAGDADPKPLPASIGS